ncbi:hypothetical protein [Aquisalimonas sp.]|uniref:hypothetical protein n=1 Tax=Aquisalimonas sp. TaxID=1872621 RepID=UPI0025C3E488|nr:hypothetical protein [Aquisalimonas sp.]
MTYRVLRTLGPAVLIFIWLGGVTASDDEAPAAGDAFDITEGETHVIADEMVSGEGEWRFELSSFNQVLVFELDDGDPNKVLGYSIDWDGQQEPIEASSEDTPKNEEFSRAEQIPAGEFVVTVYGGDDIRTEIVLRHPADHDE